MRANPRQAFDMVNVRTPAFRERLVCVCLWRYLRRAHSTRLDCQSAVERARALQSPDAWTRLLNV